METQKLNPMEPRINHKLVQEKWQQKRINSFKSVPDHRKAYTILNPPPNITGILHIGHFLNSLFNDVMARRKRQEGFNVCFTVGLDGAGLATQTKIEQYLKQQGLTKEMLGREKFMEQCDIWKEKYGNTIINQFKAMGLSCDWDRLTFTLDKSYSKNVIETFVKLYEGGLVYKGNYMTNWCTTLQTAISDEECISSEEEIGLYYINYKLENSDVYLTVATTRPETMFGDVAVAYNPEDERYKQYKGMNVLLPILGKSIPLVEDERIKIEFGTGLCKITPAHDKNDFATAQKYNLPVLTIFDNSGHIANTGTKYDGMFKDKARKEVLKELTDLNLLVDTQKKKSDVLRCSRTNVLIEPMITKQWFVKMAPLAEMASDLLKNGEVEFVPARTTNVFNAWVANIRDWCVSRQIMYSHQIPVWYCPNGHEICKSVKPDCCDQCKNNGIHIGNVDLTQESDTLDTWASSYIWQFGTFTEAERDYYYPVDLMVSGQDILFFWIMRMMMTSAYLHNKPPFKKVLFHGIVRDDHNKKMSKSAGNAVDPLEMIAQIGLDPMRFSMLMIAPKDGDLKISAKSFDVGKTFCTKLWNVARCLQMSKVFEELNDSQFELELTIEDKNILVKLDELKIEISDCYDKLDFQRLATSLYTFTWDYFANGYLEYVKGCGHFENNILIISKDRKKMLLSVFVELLKLLHPIIPHVTEELWEIMGRSDLYLQQL